MSRPLDSATIAVAGDLLGHLIGTVSTVAGTTAIRDAEIAVHGFTPTGRWERASTSDANGFFQIDLPFGTVGDISINAVRDDLRAEVRIGSTDIARGLTPRPFAGSSNRLPLDGEWAFVTDPPPDFWSRLDQLPWGKINVPAHWEMEGFVAASGLGLYKTTVRIPKAWSAKRVRFRSEGIYSQADVWLNGNRVGSHDGGATPFELDVTEAARPGQDNVVVIRVADRSDAGNLDAMGYYAHINLAGIWRPLELFCVEPVHVSRLCLVTDFDREYRDAELILDLDIVNEQLVEPRVASLTLRVNDSQGKELARVEPSAQVSLGPLEQKHVTLRVKVDSPEQWNAEKPRLHTLILELTAPAQESSTIEQHFGFRQVEIRGRTYLLNGRPVKFWGSCRHDAHPLHGRAITADIARRDAELMKGANLNAFRTTHYPPHPVAIEYADEYGFYVEDEAPLCFVSVPYGPEIGRERNLANDLRLAPLAISLTSQLIERDRNHPSVVVWSQCNESKYGTILALARDFIRISDPTRPISAGQSTKVDLATYHCPTSMQRLTDTANCDVPVLFDEGFPVFQGFGAQADGLDLDPGLRDYWVTAHFEPVEALLRSEHQFGAMIWAWVDDTFLVPGKGLEYGRRDGPPLHFVDRVYDTPGRGIKGDPPWGIVDGWRRPRPEWWLCKKLFSPIKIDERPLAVPRAGEPIAVGIENRNVFVDLREYRCRWHLATEAGEIRVDVEPLSQATIQITSTHLPSADDTLVLEFFDERGRLVDGARLAFRPRVAPVRSTTAGRARIVEEPTELTFASIIRLVGSNAELAFERTSGALARGLAGRQQILRQGPSLHVMKTTAPLEAYPNDWHLTGTTGSTKGDHAVLQWNGRYGNQFAGGFEIRMDGGGNVEIGYNFIYDGLDITAREVGLSLDVPLACDRLEWDRRAEWSYYPDDHIGRPRGVAVAHPGVSQTVPPGDRPFGQDDHPWGSNDFRSAKRQVYWTSITNPNGAGIRVISDGTQHIRATMLVHAISLKVLDFYGGAGTGRSEWDKASYGNGLVIRAGDIVKGVINLKLLGSSADA